MKNRIDWGSVFFWSTLTLSLLLLLIVTAWKASGQETSSTTRTMTVTAYCPCAKCCGRYADGITASGQPVTANRGRFVAADRSLPFGTLVSVPGYNEGRPVPVLDRGGAIRGNHLDVFFPTHAEALRWGRQTLRCTIGEVAP
jgi:3D (Asp-Asp-Asp) domain-containing protein